MDTQAHFQVITLFPEMIDNITNQGVVGQARKKELVSVTCINPRKFTNDVHNTVDDRPFGGGDGMVMLAEPLEKALLEARENRPAARRIYLSPQGKPLSQAKVNELAAQPDLILLCGRYSGVDQRLLYRHIDEEVSLGDYVISGGELAASVLIDAVSRFVPGVLGHKDSASFDSFAGQGGLLEAPLFTRPRELWGMQAPEILFSGHHAKIKDWQRHMGMLVSFVKRPDLEPFKDLGKKEAKALIASFEALSPDERQMMGLKDLSVSVLREKLNV